MSHDEIMQEYAERINKALEHYLPDVDCAEKNVCEAMRYSVTAGGKRIRPILLLEFCRLCGGDTEAALPFACAVEMIHTYSLIHDDLPCMDNDDLRRGRPSCHIKFGEATALLAGDALLSLAFETALCNNYLGKINPVHVIEATHELARASGAMGMVGGQIIDLESENREVSLKTLEMMHKKKTGAMIIASAKMGCILAGADREKIKAAEAYAERVGLVFQIVDDILDVTSSDEKLGKPAGSDQDNSKTTYVTLLGIEKSREIVSKMTDEACAALNCFGEEKAFLENLAEKLATRES